MKHLDLKSRYRGCLLGLACGDALGTTLEFQPPGTFEPLTDMVGGGPFVLKAGQWTDDTSMALCLAESLLECQGFDAKDQMERYLRWFRKGYLSSTGRCFDIGNTVSEALRLFEVTGKAMAGSTHPYSAGNGSLMRLAPVPMFFFRRKDCGMEELLAYAEESSKTTHGADECLDACRYFAWLLVQIFEGHSKELLERSSEELGFTSRTLSIGRIADGKFLNKPIQKIRGSGYVVESLEAALWCFFHSSSYQEAVLLAANLGDDADTTAAICGQVAGAYYGEEGIPGTWLDKLHMREEIGQLAESLIASH